MEAFKLGTTKFQDKFLIVVLEIPDGANTNIGRSNVLKKNKETAKYRCDKAKVIDIYDLDYNKHSEAYSIFKNSFCYKVGEIITEPLYDKNKTNVCTTGIHFFLNEYMAYTYQYFYMGLNDNFKDGNVTLYDDNGLITEEFTIKDGVFEGKHSLYCHEHGVKKTIEYKKGNQTGYLHESRL